MASFRPRSLTDFGAILWRRKWLFLLIAAAMLQATYLVARTVPNLYEGRAQVAVVVKPGDDTGSLSTQITALQHRTLSRELLAPLISKQGLIKPGEDMDAAATRLRTAIKMDVKLRAFYPEFPETITITYRHADPKVAHAVVTHILSHFINTNETLSKQAAVQVREVEQELSGLVGALSKITNERNAATKSPALAAVEDPRLLRRQLLSEINSLSDKQFMLERQLEVQQKQIAEQKTVAQTTPNASGATATTSYGFMLAEKARLQAVIKDYRKQYTEDNPKLKQGLLQLSEVEQTIARLEKTGDGGATKLSGPEAQVLRSLEREAEKQQTEIELTKRNLEAKRMELSRVPTEVPEIFANANTSAEAQATSTAEYERLSKRYFWLLDRKDALAKAQADLNEGPNITLFRLIDSAYVPDIPVAPNKLLLRLLCLGMALGTAILVVGFTEARNFFRIEDERDVEYFLGAPVVGLIPETLTPVENSRIRRQKLARVGLVVGIVIVMIPTVMLVLQQVGIFNVIGSK
jgi:uncharacterized protein involved in exopolysaccharide biosynthesis